MPGDPVIGRGVVTESKSAFGIGAREVIGIKGNRDHHAIEPAEDVTQVYRGNRRRRTVPGNTTIDGAHPSLLVNDLHYVGRNIVTDDRFFDNGATTLHVETDAVRKVHPVIARSLCNLCPGAIIDVVDRWNLCL